MTDSRAPFARALDRRAVLSGGLIGVGSLGFTADNPGNWLFHCHNAYHMEAGMARVVRIA